MCIKLFELGEDSVTALPATQFSMERQLQRLMEAHLQTLLGIRCLKSEYEIRGRQSGRIDTLGLDENNTPVILEYKRHENENVINQGLYYLDWLMNNTAEFQLYVQEKLGVEVAKSIDWTTPRLICVAWDFNRYDLHAVQQIPRHIELIRYRRYGDAHLMLEQLHVPTNLPVRKPVTRVSSEMVLPSVTDSESVVVVPAPTIPPAPGGIEQSLKRWKPEIRARFQRLVDEIHLLGEDIEYRPLSTYFAFRRLQNFVCVVPTHTKNQLWLYLKLDPSTVELEPGFSRDGREVWHHGTGDLELLVDSDDDLEKALPLIQLAYERN